MHPLRSRIHLTALFAVLLLLTGCGSPDQVTASPVSGVPVPAQPVPVTPDDYVSPRPPKRHPGLAWRGYDISFRKYSEMYMPGRDWRLLKAQCYAESAFDPDAVSPGVGAQGLCQFMPDTWLEETQQAGISGSPFQPDLAIQAASYYMAQLRRYWTAPRPQDDREKLGIASYNAGPGNILKAQKKCGGPSLYDEIVPCLPMVTGKANAQQTTSYVDAIWNYFDQLVRGF